MTSKELLEEAVAWGSGQKSYMNSFMDVEDGTRQQTLVHVAMADAFQAQAFYTAALAAYMLEEDAHYGG